MRPIYEHRQFAVVQAIAILVIVALAAALVLFAPPPARGALNPRATPVIALVILGFGGLVALMASVMTVRIDQRDLRWSFGPGFPRFRRALRDIVGVEPIVLSRWAAASRGIRWSRDGWRYTVGGRGAVLVRLKGKKSFVLGTDEPDRLAAALRRAARIE